MEQELRRVYYDPELGVEACLFQGIDQGFPEHFHTYYVIGTMDRGSREVTIAGETLRLAPGELVFFQPGEPHACRPVGEERLDWRGLHVPQEVRNIFRLSRWIVKGFLPVCSISASLWS